MQEIEEKLKEIKRGSIFLRTMTLDLKNKILKNLKDNLRRYEAEILASNQRDLENYKKSDKFQNAFLDRLSLNSSRIQQMIDSIDSIEKAKDPVGESISERVLDNGLVLKKIRGPIGVCFLIFESRPNVITEAFSLALKSSNAIILKGGRESDETAKLLYELINKSIIDVVSSECFFWGMTGASRDITNFLMKQSKLIDVLIPRGGDPLISYVTENSTLPLIKNDKGLCHIYVHSDANIEMALDIVDNAKTQRPGVCNSMETLIVDEDIASHFLPELHSRITKKNVEIYACPKAYKILDQFDVNLIDDKSFKTEYLDLKLNIKVVESIVEGLEHIERYGSRHSEAIITENKEVVHLFFDKVDAAVAYWNASTRFTDGYQFGLGGEIGISTQKLHVRGPVGLEELTVTRYIVEGQGQIRE